VHVDFEGFLSTKGFPMKRHTNEQPANETQQAKKPRFKIEKLEERIAPHHRSGHVRGSGHYGQHCHGKHADKGC
jgi:hypothetical protein